MNVTGAVSALMEEDRHVPRTMIRTVWGKRRQRGEPGEGSRPNPGGEKSRRASLER